MFDRDSINSKLANLSFKKQLVFAASCCERLLPFYLAFSKVENWGNPALLSDALDKIWEIAKTEQTSNEELAILSRYCQDSIPDSEDFSSPYTTMAQEAGIAIYTTLEFCRTKEAVFLGGIAQTAYNAIQI